MSAMKRSHRIVTAQQASACGEQPLTGFDLGMPVDGFCIALVYPKPLDELLLIASLQKALDQTPYFAGRLFGIGSALPLAIPNNEGALFTYNEFTSSMLPFGIDQPLKPHLPRFVHDMRSFGFDHHTPLLQVQLTNFPNGCILGISISHALCDGTSMIEFIRCWATYATGSTPYAPPCWNRRDIQQLALGDGRDTTPQSLVVELKEPFPLNTQPVDTAIFRLSASMLNQLQEKYVECSSNITIPKTPWPPGMDTDLHDDSLQDGFRPSQSLRKISQQDIVVAYVYLLLLRSFNNAGDLPSLSIVCNIRRILELPDNYLGNAICLRHLQPETNIAIDLDIVAMARRIRALQSEITAKSLRHELAFWQKRGADGTAAQFISLATRLALSGGVLIDNMSKFAFYELDFGCGLPIWIDTPPPPSPAPVARGVLLLPAPPTAGGIDLHISLPHAEMTRLHHFMSASRADSGLPGELISATTGA
jgi:shikimate O-hydroxycinnamoyltransferase